MISRSQGLLNQEMETVVEGWGGRWSREHACNHTESTRKTPQAYVAVAFWERTDSFA
jgi:hypothetical protein